MLRVTTLFRTKLKIYKTQQKRRVDGGDFDESEKRRKLQTLGRTQEKLNFLCYIKRKK